MVRVRQRLARGPAEELRIDIHTRGALRTTARRVASLAEANETRGSLKTSRRDASQVAVDTAIDAAAVEGVELRWRGEKHARTKVGTNPSGLVDLSDTTNREAPDLHARIPCSHGQGVSWPRGCMWGELIGS